VVFVELDLIFVTFFVVIFTSLVDLSCSEVETVEVLESDIFCIVVAENRAIFMASDRGNLEAIVKAGIRLDLFFFRGFYSRC